MFTTSPLFGKFHSPLHDAGLALRHRPLHHLESLCAQRLDPLERVSFTGTRDAAYHYSQAIARIPASQPKRRRLLYAQMLATIASDLVPERPNRREPRCQKRRPKAY